MKRFRSKPSMSLFACAACALGLLLWARLLLVSSPPRIATAEPAPARGAGAAAALEQKNPRMQPASSDEAEKAKKAIVPAHSDH